MVLVLLMLGTTILAQGEGIGRTGAIIALTLLAVSPLGLYLVAAAYWGGWSPDSADRRIRTIRAALTWAFIVGAYLTSGILIFGPSPLSWTERINGVALAAVTAISLAAIVLIRRRPRAMALGLVLPGVVGGLMMANIGSIVLGPSASQWSGPARALSLVITGSYATALVIAAMLAWPLRKLSSASAPNVMAG